MKLLFGLAALVIFSNPLISQSLTLTAEESEDMVFLYQEEKMAKDVYLTLREIYNRPIFVNISNAETHHMQMLRDLADVNGVVFDKKLNRDVVGLFQDEKIQKMYDILIKEGEKSYVDALKVGAKVEEFDIRDINNSIAATSNASLHETYVLLRQASENHLRAFVQNLENQNITYKPLILDADIYNAIISGETAKAKCCKEGAKADCKNKGNANCKKVN
jgi:hypothetical protein